MPAIITVTNLSKRYIIGHQRAKEDGIRHVIEHAVRNPLRWLRSRRVQKTREREEFWALRDVSFEVQPGEVLGIIGRNGAGKSTLLKLLSRITDPTAGRIDIDGRVASLLEVGTGFHPELTGRENIFLNGAILGMSRVEIRRKFDEIVAFSEVEQFLDTPVKRYSSGMFVRLAFAIAAHLEPEILIIDEVLAVGDSRFQEKCLGKMHEVANGGRTVLFVSHNLATVRSLCTSCILLSKGSIGAHGSTQAVLSKYNYNPPKLSHFASNELFAIDACELVEAESNATTTHPEFDGAYRLVLRIRCLQRVRFAIIISFYDSNQVLLSSINSPEEGHPFQSDLGAYEYILEMPQLSLMPGAYRAAVSICNEQQGFLAHDDAINFTVEPANLHGAPWAYNHRHGSFRLAQQSRLTRLPQP